MITLANHEIGIEEFDSRSLGAMKKPIHTSCCFAPESYLTHR